MLFEDLVFTNRVTRGTGQHKVRTIQADVLAQLKSKGKTIEPGQKIQYVVSDYSRRTKRVILTSLAKQEFKYDVKRYSRLLDEYCNSLIEPFM